MLGPLLFNLYTADIIRIAESFNVSIHCYTDDIQLYVSCFAADAPAAVARLLACIEVINRWLGSNKLKMNPDKTQLIWLGTWQRLAKIAITPFTLHDGTIITPSMQVRSLGVILDNELTMTAHVSCVVRACVLLSTTSHSLHKIITDWQSSVSFRQCWMLLHMLSQAGSDTTTSHWCYMMSCSGCPFSIASNIRSLC